MNDTTNIVSVSGITASAVATANMPKDNVRTWISLAITLISSVVVIITNVVKLYKTSDNVHDFCVKLANIFKKIVTLFKKGNNDNENENE